MAFLKQGDHYRGRESPASETGREGKSSRRIPGGMGTVVTVKTEPGDYKPLLSLFCIDSRSPWENHNRFISLYLNYRNSS